MNKLKDKKIFKGIGFLIEICMYVMFPIYFLFVYMLTYLRYSIEFNFSLPTDIGFFLSFIGLIGLIIKLQPSKK